MPPLLRDVSEKANSVAELFHTPFLTLIWRLAFIAAIGIGAYAFNAYKHAMITDDSTVQQLLTDTASQRALVTSHEMFIQDQSKANAKLDTYFREARDDRDKINISITSLSQHLSDQDKTLDRIEGRLDSHLDSAPSR